MNIFTKIQPYALGLLRIIAGYMFLLHGTAKFFEFPVSMTGGNGAVLNDGCWRCIRNRWWNLVYPRAIHPPSRLFIVRYDGCGVFPNSRVFR